MSTCRSVILDALLSIKAISLGDSPTVDELNLGLSTLQKLMLEWCESLGPLVNVDISADYLAGVGQKVRIQNGATVTVTLPNAVPLYINNYDPFDYDFWPTQLMPPAGLTGPSDGISSRAPRDGERIEIVGVTQALYFYRADVNNWSLVYGLALDGQMPTNARYDGPWAAKLAERLIPVWPDVNEPTPVLAKRIAQANLALLSRSGIARDPVRADYF